MVVLMVSDKLAWLERIQRKLSKGMNKQLGGYSLISGDGVSRRDDL